MPQMCEQTLPDKSFNCLVWPNPFSSTSVTFLRLYHSGSPRSQKPPSNLNRESFNMEHYFLMRVAIKG